MMQSEHSVVDIACDVSRSSKWDEYKKAELKELAERLGLEITEIQLSALARYVAAKETQALKSNFEFRHESRRMV